MSTQAICGKCGKAMGHLVHPIDGENYCPLCAVKVARVRHAGKFVRRQKMKGGV